jgi:hypothetical protein
LPNLSVYVLDADLEPCPEGVPGELFVGGIGVGRGYAGRPELTAERFVPDPHGPPGGRLYRTGDLGRRLPDGSVEYLGRVDFQVKIRGQRIELGEIESALARLPGTRDAVVVARDDGRGGFWLVAYVVPSSGATLESESVKGDLREVLPEYMVPPVVLVLDALPLTANGKVDRKALPVPHASEAAHEPPEGPVEELLARMWAGILGIERIGRGDNFFELGGQSLLAARVVASVKEELGLELPIRRLFEAPTLAAYAEAVAAILPDLGTSGLSEEELDAELQSLLDEEDID